MSAMNEYTSSPDYSAKLFAALLDLTASATGLTELVGGVCDLVYKQLGVDAVAVRLQRELDFPYVDSRGFPAEFVEARAFAMRARPLRQPRLR